MTLFIYIERERYAFSAKLHEKHCPFSLTFCGLNTMYVEVCVGVLGFMCVYGSERMFSFYSTWCSLSFLDG